MYIYWDYNSCLQIDHNDNVQNVLRYKIFLFSDAMLAYNIDILIKTLLYTKGKIKGKKNKFS